MNSIAYMDAMPIKCDRCGKMVIHFYNKGEWWEKYLLPDEDQICYGCIKDRSDFKEKFKQNIGISAEEFEKIK